jgi:hypothetical protein
VDARAKDDEALLGAAKFGHARVLQRLLRHISCDAADASLLSAMNEALLRALKAGSEESVLVILEDERFLVTNDVYKLVLWRSDAAQAQARGVAHVSCSPSMREAMRPTIEKKLLSGQIDPKFTFNKAINIALQAGDVRTIRLFMELADRDPRVDFGLWRSFFCRIAAEHGHTEILRLLMQRHEVDPSDADNAALRYAAESGQVDCVRLLLADERVRSRLRDSDVRSYEAQYGLK